MLQKEQTKQWTLFRSNPQGVEERKVEHSWQMSVCPGWEILLYQSQIILFHFQTLIEAKRIMSIKSKVTVVDVITDAKRQLFLEL